MHMLNETFQPEYNTRTLDAIDCSSCFVSGKPLPLPHGGNNFHA